MANHVYSQPEKAPQMARLAEIEETITLWRTSGKLWDYEDENVAAILKERDSLFQEINPHLSGMSFFDMSDEDYEEIDKKAAEEADLTPEKDENDG